MIKNSLEMNNALIGYTGFIGKNLLDLYNFEFLYNSKNISEIENKKFNYVFCAGLPAEKWKVNKYPKKDYLNMISLFDKLTNINMKKIILFSTVDVYDQLNEVNEYTDINIKACNDYGKNRLIFETRLKNTFKDKLVIVRLPGLFSNYLKKNVVFDLKHSNQLDKINPNSAFQYYYLKDLKKDLDIILKNDLNLINLLSEPIKTSEIINNFFPKFKYLLNNNFENNLSYNIQSIHAKYWNSKKYMFDKKYIFSKLKNYFQI